MSKKRKAPQVKNVGKNRNVDSDRVAEIDYPVFCFKYLESTSIKGSRDSAFFTNFLQRLQRLSCLSWNEIDRQPMHGYGTEEIPVEQLIPRPCFIIKGREKLTVFRANTDNRVFLGFREGAVFNIVYIETRFGDIYDHG
jgi:hypothetical protein